MSIGHNQAPVGEQRKSARHGGLRDDLLVFGELGIFEAGQIVAKVDHDAMSR